jgi:Uma2 family endonuclease
MARLAPVARMTCAEYLAAEAKSEVRHEYLNGEVREIAGSSPEHSGLAAAITGELGTAVRGQRCRLYSCNARVRILDTGLSTYPDVSAVCGQLETAPDDKDAITNPIVLVEVLSEATEAYDRGAKWAHYRRIPSLREYVLLSQTEPLVEVYRRAESGRWELLEARSGETIELASVGVRLEVASIYANPLGQ